MLGILDPTIAAPRARIDYAPRPLNLQGLRIGLIENTKKNSEAVLRKLAERAARDHGMSMEVGAVIFGGEHTELLRRSGWSKRKIQEFVVEHSGRTRLFMEAAAFVAICSYRCFGLRPARTTERRVFIGG